MKRLKKPFALKISFDYISAPRQTRFVEYGEVSERLKEHAWKVCIREIVSRVRISPSPPSSAKPLEVTLPGAFCILASADIDAVSKSQALALRGRSRRLSLAALLAASDRPDLGKNAKIIQSPSWPGLRHVQIISAPVQFDVHIRSALMDAISYTSARANLADTMDRVCNDHEALIITRNGQQSVVML